MSQTVTFSDVLDAAKKLDADGQAELVEVLSRRLAERGCAQVAVRWRSPGRESAAGQWQSMTAAEIVRDAQS